MATRRGGPLRHDPTPEMLQQVARRFRTLAEPARLLVLHTLEAGECSVSALAGRLLLPHGTLSRHLQVLYEGGFVRRRREGQFVYYQLADEQVLQLCALMCDRLESEVDSARGALTRP